MKKTVILLIITAFTLITAHTMQAQEKETIVLIETNMGKIKVKLYNDTPLHRDNFIKLVKEGVYNDLLFHRVIRQFMIQGGDTHSKNAPQGKVLGDNELNYKIPAEIIYPKHFHKNGALCAARTGDDVNPEKASSPTQFYIVTGKYFTDMELDKIEKQRAERLKSQLYNRLRTAENDTIKTYYRAGARDSLTVLQQTLLAKAEQELQTRINETKFTPEQREAYKLQGGTPELDKAYTVFGEVIDGIKVAEKISLMETDANDRPIKNIKMKMKIVEK